MANRDRHRQGLIYGPVPPSGPRDRGRLVGNLLGLLVVVVTVAVLALAIYLFAQSRGSQPVTPVATATHLLASSSPSPSASPTTVRSASPSAIAIATVSPVTPPPTAVVPTPEPTPPAPTSTPGPTIFVPPVMTGRGFITFGTNNDARYHVLDPKTTFALDEPMVWSAYLTEPASATDLRIRILVLDASEPTGQRLVREDEVRPDATSQIFFRRLRPLGLSTGPGLFTIQYLRGDQVLSQGSFLIQ